MRRWCHSDILRNSIWNINLALPVSKLFEFPIPMQHTPMLHQLYVLDVLIEPNLQFNSFIYTHLVQVFETFLVKEKVRTFYLGYTMVVIWWHIEPCHGHQQQLYWPKCPHIASNGRGEIKHSHVSMMAMAAMEGVVKYFLIFNLKLNSNPKINSLSLPLGEE